MSQNIMKMKSSKFNFTFMSLLTAKFVKSICIWARIYFVFLKTSLNKLEILLIQNIDSMKGQEKQLPNKPNFSPFLQLICSNFGLKQCEKPQIYQNYQIN